MWIRFSSTSDTPFIVKIYAGGVNVVSGEPAVETEATMNRRAKLMEQEKSIQDYIVAPQQRRLDGVAYGDGTIRQFVAMPLGEGYSVEAQVTGSEVIGGLQFEVTPTKIDQDIVIPLDTPQFDVVVKTLTGKETQVTVSASHTVYETKVKVEEKEGCPTDQQRLIYAGEMLEDDRTLGFYRVGHETTLTLVLRLRGGGQDEEELTIAPGGIIYQTIREDKNDVDNWDPDCSALFNVQVFNSARFCEITGKELPTTPVTAETYAECGGRYFEIFDEKPSEIKGKFDGIQSVNAIDIRAAKSKDKQDAVLEMGKDIDKPVVPVDEKGNRVGLRTVLGLEKAVRGRFDSIPG